MQSEHKTQIYLSGQEHRALQQRARAERRSMAAIVREAVAEYLRRPIHGGAWGEDTITQIVGIGEGHPMDSELIDEVLYGDAQ
jgi:hypothetical protein